MTCHDTMLDRLMKPQLSHMFDEPEATGIFIYHALNVGILS